MGTGGYEPDVEPMVQLGGPFLSQIYVGVDYENNEFFVAPIKRDGTKSTYKKLGCDDQLPGKFVTAQDDSAATSGKKKAPLAAIVGGVVGGLVAIAFAAIGFLYVRRRRAEHTLAGGEKAGAATSYKAMYQGNPADGPGEAIYEVDSPAPAPPRYQNAAAPYTDRIEPAELGDAAPAFEMPGSPGFA